MPWSEEANGGFTSGTSWIQCAVDPARTVAAEEKDPRSVLHFYRRLLALRRENDCLRRGEFALLHNEDGTVLYQNTLAPAKRWLPAASRTVKPPCPTACRKTPRCC